MCKHEFANCKGRFHVIAAIELRLGGCFLYGSETWTVNERMRKRIDGMYNQSVSQSVSQSINQSINQF